MMTTGMESIGMKTVERADITGIAPIMTAGKPMKRLVRSALFAALIPASPLMADGTAVFATGNTDAPLMTFYWQDRDHTRLEADGQPAHVLAIDGKAYGVVEMNGRAVAMNLESLSAILGASGDVQRLGPNTVVPTHITAFETTGQTEVVAGIEGEVYQVSWEDSNGQARMDEAVLSRNPLVGEMQRALIQGMTQAMARSTGVSGQEAASHELERRGLAVLRFADDFRLESINDADLSEATFALPRAPVDLQRLLKGVMGG